MEIEYRSVEYGQLGNLEAAHPAVARLGPGEDHYPACFRSLPTCPDVYDTFPCYFYLLSRGRIAASLAALPDSLSAEGRTFAWAWVVSFYTSPDCRGQGLGAKLWGAATQTLHDRALTIAGAFANPVTTHICRNMGFTVPERVPRLLLLKTVRPVLSYHLPGTLLASVLDVPYRAVAGGVKFLTGANRFRASGAELVRAANLDDLGHPQDAAAIRYDNACHFNDGWDKFRWKLPQCRNSEVYFLADRPSGHIRARFVLKSRDVKTPVAEKYTGFRLMTLMDFVFFAEPEASYGALADAVVSLFWESDADVLETVSASPTLNARLRRKLLVPGGKGVAFWYKTPPGVTLPPGASDIRNWHFTHFCTDAFSFA